MDSSSKRRDVMRGGYTDGDDIHISDVIEAIQETDPEYKVNASNYTPSVFTPISQGLFTDSVVEQKHRAKCIIIEQPASKALRFRYECEGRSAGSLPGASNSSEKKSFPAVKVEGYKGLAVVVVSCVTKDHPHRPHPHNLVGKEGCKKGVCTMNVDPDTMTCVFSNLGIQCVKKKYIEESLRLRESLQVDPFRTGFAHKSQPSSIDLNVVRLCFQVFLEGDKPGQFTFPLDPVVSTEIFDKKSMSDLVIIKMSHCSASVAGGQEVIVLCEKICRDDISLRFYEEQDNQIVWEAFGEFQPSDVHKQVAISFKTPKYKNIEIQDPVTVYVQLLRPSNGVTSSSKPFILTPLDSALVSSEVGVLDRKRKKHASHPNGLSDYVRDNNTQIKQDINATPEFDLQLTRDRQRPLSGGSPQYAFSRSQNPPTTNNDGPFLNFSPQDSSYPSQALLFTALSQGRPPSPYNVQQYQSPSFQEFRTQPPLSASPRPDLMPQFMPASPSESPGVWPTQGRPVATSVPQEEMTFSESNAVANFDLAMLCQNDSKQNIMDLDSGLINIQPGELSGLELPNSDINFSILDSQLSENLSAISLEDEPVRPDDRRKEDVIMQSGQSMDSFTKLTRETANQIAMLNNLNQ